MKRIVLLLTICFFYSNFNTAQNYNLTLKSTVNWSGKYVANIWGFAKNGKEYALVGVSNGMVVVDVTDANAPVIVKQLTDTITSLWREIKTYGNYAFVTSEGSSPTGHGGVGIANLTNLPDTAIPFKKYHGDAGILNKLKQSHALHVDTTKGYCYIYGATGLANGGAIALNLNVDPYNPQFAGMQTTRYIHDGYIDNDTMYAGELLNGVRIVNFANKSAPVSLATFQTPNSFCHNTWPSNNKDYLFTTDEKEASYLAAYDVSDIGNITELDKIQPTPGSGSIVHNTYIKGNHAITSWYRDGFTITDISRPGNLIQVARYDTYPEGAGNGFQGCWGVYPYLPSGNILVTNITNSAIGEGSNTGKLFVFTPDYKNACFLEGTVTDTFTNLQLNGVDVKINHTDPLNGTTTGISGSYATGQVTPGTVTVTYSKTGYVSKTISADLTAGGLTIKNVQLRTNLSLPLEYVEIKATKVGSQNKIIWTTSNERNTVAHILQRKTGDQGTWEDLGVVKPYGNSPQVNNQYEFVDVNPGLECYYRIKTIDSDQSDYYSTVVSVIRPAERFEVVNIYPNPSSGLLNLQLAAPGNQATHVALFTMAGKKVFEATYYLSGGLNSLEVQLPETLSAETYILSIDNGAEKHQQKINLFK